MTDTLASTKEQAPPRPERAGLSDRDQDWARVAAILAEGLVPRPRSSWEARADVQAEEDAAPIDLDAVLAEAGPPPPPPRAAPRGRPMAAARPRGLAALHWFFQTLLLLFVLVWVFLLGIFIGRGYLMESRAGRELIAWVSEIIDRQSGVSIEEEARPPAFPGPVSEILKTVLAAARSAAPETPPEEPEEDSQFLTPESLAEEGAATEPEAEPTEPEAPAAKAELAPLSRFGYVVQTTFEVTERAARARTERLKSQGFPAYFYKNSRDQYLIRVGRFARVEDAISARDRLAAIRYKDSYIAKRDPGER